MEPRPVPSKDDEFTESKMNPGAGADLAAAFTGDTYRIMLVANKFQTGFDQPLLSAMYVDRKLSGVTTVQTLSRLNRTHRTAGGEQKTKTFVIDFANKPDDIRAAFEPYYTDATLETETDPYVVVHLANKLAHAGIYTEEQVRKVAELWVTRKGNNALSAAISPAQHGFRRRYAAAIEAGDKVTLNSLDLFRKDVSTYVRLYDFMSQMVDYGDPYLEMLCKMNDLFGAEVFVESQVREFVQGLVQRLLADPGLVQQTRVNTKKQFMESQDFQSAVNEAVADNQVAHNTMAEYFFSEGPAIKGVVVALADAFYEAAIDREARAR